MVCRCLCDVYGWIIFIIYSLVYLPAGNESTKPSISFVQNQLRPIPARNTAAARAMAGRHLSPAIYEVGRVRDPNGLFL